MRRSAERGPAGSWVTIALEGELGIWSEVLQHPDVQDQKFFAPLFFKKAASFFCCRFAMFFKPSTRSN
jgi:hypothetical protein